MSGTPSYQIYDVTFSDDGVAFQYVVVPDDVRVKGRAVMSHVLQLSAGHPDYREDIRDLHDRARRVLRNALEDFHDSEPWEKPQDDDEDDDERGMGE